MSKGRVFLTGMLALVLVADGPTDGRAPAAVAVAPDSAVASTDLAAYLGRLNPWLSAYELERIGHAVVRYSDKYGLDPMLVMAVIEVESTAQPWARSPKGAIGLMQVMPHMAAPMRMAGNLATIESNVEAGCLILASNIRRLGEDDGISAYFWGSHIRGVAYLDRVRAARAAVRQQLRS